MELVIRISDELYRDIQKRSAEIQAEGDVLENAVLNGKPLIVDDIIDYQIPIIIEADTEKEGEDDA